MIGSPVRRHGFGQMASESAATDRMAADANSKGRLALLVRRNATFVWRCLRRLGVPPADTDDAAQQVFMIVSDKLNDIEPGSERAFLFATARGVAANARRKIARRPESTDDALLATLPDDAPGPDATLEKREARELLDEILERMSPELREVFVLFEIEDMTTTEIARTLDIPVGTVASRLRRAREQLRGHLARLRARLEGSQP